MTATDTPTTERRPMTEQQAKVYWAVVRHHMETGGWPALRELGDSLGISSPNGIACHLVALQKKGWLTWKHPKTKARGIRIPELVEAARLAGQALALRESSTSRQAGATGTYSGAAARSASRA